MTDSARLEPDWGRMHRISAEADALQRAGKLTRAEFDRLFAAYAAATRGHEQFCEGMAAYAEPGWLEGGR